MTSEHQPVDALLFSTSLRPVYLECCLVACHDELKSDNPRILEWPLNETQSPARHFEQIDRYRSHRLHFIQKNVQEYIAPEILYYPVKSYIHLPTETIALILLLYVLVQ